MRWACISIALAALLLPSRSASTAQLSWSLPQNPTTTSQTLVDALGQDPDFVSLLKLLQRARLIPTLNRLNGSTLFAPTNEAIKRYAEEYPLWNNILEDDSFVVTDNIQAKLRQQLFYHLLNYSLPNLPTNEEVQVHKTLHYPSVSLEPPTREPPPNPPWMPIPGGSLGGEPQRLRIATKDDGIRVAVDAFGKGGAHVVKGQRDAGNGVLLGIDQVLDTPPNLADVVSKRSSVSYFNKIFGPEMAQRLNSSSNLTLFLPVDEAWNELDPYERLYLESEFATDDLNLILNMHAVLEDSVKWSESFTPGINLTSLGGNSLEIVSTPEGTKVSSADLVEPDIYASNGVLHLVSSLLLPPDAIQITPEKYLLALNCTTFVSLLHSADLTHLINDTNAKYTILAPSDDILSILGDSELPEPGTEELKRLLRYHFIPGRWVPKKLDDGQLLETELFEEGLAGGRQVLSVDVHSDSGKKKGSKTIRFGGAGIIGEPIEVNNTLLYFISKPLIPPADPLETALPDLDWSSFLAALLSSPQAEILRTTPHTTLLFPRNEAFRRLGLLVSNHLFSASAKQDLANVLLHHALDTVQYTPDLLTGAQHTFATLEGSDVKLSKGKNGTINLGSSGGWEGLNAEIIPRNILTKTGVIHEVSDILLPRSVHITIEKLMRAAKGSIMTTLVNKAGYDWLLNGTAPPEDSPWADKHLGWTVLCPPDDAFKQYNLTELYADIPGIKEFVQQHLIPIPTSPETEPGLRATGEGEGSPTNLNPINNRPLNFDDASYTTLRSSESAYGDLSFQKTEDGGYVVGIKGARGTDGEADFARVISWGRSTTGSGTGGVIQIDKLLVPYKPKWWVEYGAPSVVGTLGIVVICGFFYGVRIILKRDTTEATYEPVGGFSREDDDGSG